MPILALSEALTLVGESLKRKNFRVSPREAHELADRFNPMFQAADERHAFLTQEKQKRTLSIEERHELRLHLANKVGRDMLAKIFRRSG